MGLCSLCPKVQLKSFQAFTAGGGLDTVLQHAKYLGQIACATPHELSGRSAFGHTCFEVALRLPLGCHGNATVFLHKP